MLASMKTPEISEWMTSVARAGSTTLGPTDATSPRSQPDRPALPTATSFDLSPNSGVFELAAQVTPPLGARRSSASSS